MALLSALAPAHALAWGVEGHKIVALLAWNELDPAARAQMGALLGSEATFVRQSNWADEVREQRLDTARWHYVDIPLAAPGYDPRRDCAMQACVVAQIDKDLQLLRHRGLDKAVRAEALLFLVHFVADLHQPLHAADNDDKGGNAVRVWLEGKPSNLHRVWDVDVVEALGSNAGAVAADIESSLTPAQRKAWAHGTPISWANEAHAIARDRIYPPFEGSREVVLAPGYAQQQAPLVHILLARAGVRLGWLLNGALK
jgi:hypothetical protein